jgi:Phytanoyl-CoA dioxygenase (PhyH)
VTISHIKLLKNLHYVSYRQWHYGVLRWRYILNRHGTLRHYRQPLTISSSFARQVLDRLRKYGVADFHICDLSHGKERFDQILREEQDSVKKNRAQIEDARSVLKAGIHQAFKDFLVRVSPGKEYHQASAQLALDADLLGIVNAYLGMYSDLRNLEFWYTVASPYQEATASQLWHRDFEDTALVKVFLYLNDVDSDTGPFCFVPGTHRGYLRRRDPESVISNGTIRADDESMAVMVPRERWFIGTRPAGTIIIAATKGYHKGGLATKHDRRMLTMAYMSRSCKENYLPGGITGLPADAHPALKFAAQRQ